MKLSDRMYDILKWICLIVLPAVAWGYGELAKLWGFPYATEIPSTINLIATVAGICLGFSTLTYNKDKIQFEEEEYVHGDSADFE